MALGDAFVWGKAGAKLTPDQIAKQREIADALMKTGMDYSPVGSWSQGAARVGQGIMGALDSREADQAEKSNSQFNSQLMAALNGGVAVPDAPAERPGFLSSLFGGSKVPASDAQSQVAATSPALATGPIAPGAANDIQQQFLDTVKNGYDAGNGQKLAVTNPYGLAAIAATGKAESGYSPQNAGGTWADGKNPAGGIMSWNGPRLANLQKFAGGTNGTPQQQGQFFLQENSDLVAGLNNAKSVEEAQNLMNNAWAFKGYDQPGNPNSAHRLALAQGYLPQFQSTDAPAAAAIQQQAPIGGQQVASLDPTSGMPVGGYTDPQVTTSARHMPMPGAAAAMAGPSGQPPVPGLAVASAAQAPVQSAPAAQIPSEFAGSAQLAKSDPTSGILQPILDTKGAPGFGLTPSQQTGAPSAVSAPVGGSSSSISPAILQALSSPYASPQTQKMAALLLQSQQSRSQALYETLLKQADPQYQATLKKAQYEASHLGQITPDTQAQIDATDRKSKFDAQQAIMLADHNQALKSGDALEQANVAHTGAETANLANTNDIKEYNFAKQNGYTGSFADYQLNLKAAGRPTTTINNGDNSGAFQKKADEEAATRMGGYISDGTAANRLLGDVQQLADLGSQINTGKGAQVMATLGPYAQAMGIDVKGLGEAQAYQAIIDRMAPNMRPTGAGSSSDTDVKMFLNSLPSLGNVPGGNQIITQTLAAIQQQKIGSAQIAQKAMMPKEAGGISWQQAEQQIRDLGNPYETFNKYRQTLSQDGTKTLPSDNLTRIKSVEDYNGLPKGTQYVDPNGKVRTKN